MKGKAMTFGDAIRALRAGERVSRDGWNGKGMWLVHQPARKDEQGRTIIEHLLMKTVQGEYVPWLASQTDVLATDWGIVK